MRKVDRVVAVCLWGREVLRLNGVPDDKLVLCRQGLPRSGAARRCVARRRRRRGVRRSAARLFWPARSGQRHRHPDRRAAPNSRGAATSRHFRGAAGRFRILCPPAGKPRRRRPAHRLPGRVAARRGPRGDAGLRHRRRAVALVRDRAARRARSVRRGDAGARSAAQRHRGTRH